LEGTKKNFLRGKRDWSNLWKKFKKIDSSRSEPSWTSPSLGKGKKKPPSWPPSKREGAGKKKVLSNPQSSEKKKPACPEEESSITGGKKAEAGRTGPKIRQDRKGKKGKVHQENGQRNKNREEALYHRDTSSGQPGGKKKNRYKSP